jgi:hypothetical protein
MISNFDPAGSLIVRTVDPSGVKAHMSGKPSDFTSRFTLEMGTYDDPNTKMYIQYINPNAAQTTYYETLGSAITGGSISSSQLAVNVADANTVYNGTVLSTGGNSIDYSGTSAAVGYGLHYTSAGVSGANLPPIGGTSATGSSIRTIHVYLSNTAFCWTTNQTANINGWPTTIQANSTTFLAGPYIHTQYTRYDYWNNNTNGVSPLLYTTPRGDGIGVMANDFIYMSNTGLSPGNALAGAYLRTYGGYPPFSVLSTYALGPSSAYGFAAATYTKPSIQSGKFVNLTLASRSQGRWGGIANTVTGTFANNVVGGPSDVTTSIGYISPLAAGIGKVGFRVATQDLSTGAFQHLPIGWNAPLNGNFGGNASEQSNIYIFNGDYNAGDEYTANGVTYVIWPTYDGPMNRIGVSIPKL